MPRTEQQLLDMVYRRSAVITKRRRIAIAATVAATTVLLVGVPVLVAMTKSDTGEVIRPVTSGTAVTPPPLSLKTSSPLIGRPAPTTVPDAPATAQPGSSEAPRPSSPPSSCEVPITDERYDEKDRRLDIVSSRASSGARSMTFTHEMRDLTGVYSTGERLDWDLGFTVGGRTYIARASIGSEPMGTTERFEILRRSTGGGPSTGGYAVVARVSGTVDDDTDLITIDVPFDGFNEGEEELSAAEDREPPAELGEGSTLSRFTMRTASTKIGTTTDEATGNCSYRI